MSRGDSGDSRFTRRPSMVVTRGHLGLGAVGFRPAERAPGGLATRRKSHNAVREALTIDGLLSSPAQALNMDGDQIKIAIVIKIARSLIDGVTSFVNGVTSFVNGVDW